MLSVIANPDSFLTCIDKSIDPPIPTFPPSPEPDAFEAALIPPNPPTEPEPEPDPEPEPPPN